MSAETDRDKKIEKPWLQQWQTVPKLTVNKNSQARNSNRDWRNSKKMQNQNNFQEI